MTDLTPWIKIGDYTNENGDTQEIGLPMADLQIHTSVVGTTGSGKSTFLRSLAAQCFGVGATVYIQEPHGDLCLDAISAAPEGWLERVVYLDLNGTHPPAIPLLTAGLAAGVDVAVQMAMSVLRVAEPASWDNSTRMREILRHALIVLLAIERETASLITLNRFLAKTQSVFREEILTRCVADEAEDSKQFWLDEVCPALDREKGGADIKGSVMAAQRRVSIFLTDARFRRGLASPQLGPVISMRELLAGGKLVLAPVKVAEMGDQPAKVFGTLLMNMVTGAFLGRTDKADRQQAIVILDEFASMAGSEIGDQVKVLLAQARKFGASVVLATQSASQLPDDVRKEFDGNTNVKICLLVGGDSDARAAIASLGTTLLTPSDMVSVEKFHGYVRLQVHGAPQPPCYLKMLPPLTLAETTPTQRPAVLSKPAHSDEYKRVGELAKDAKDPTDPNSGLEVIRRLTALDEATWKAMVDEAGQANRYAATRLLAEPKLLPDKIERARRISNSLYGFPWYFREAYVRRLKGQKGGGGLPSRPPAPLSEANRGSPTGLSGMSVSTFVQAESASRTTASPSVLAVVGECDHCKSVVREGQTNCSNCGAPVTLKILGTGMPPQTQTPAEPGQAKEKRYD